MDLLNMQLFKAGIFKQIRFLLSSPQKAQRVLFISEAGTISQEVLPMHTGFISSDTAKGAWVVLHNLKFLLQKEGKQIQDEPLLLISERSYIPLDPNRQLKPKDIEKLTSLKDIARDRHAEKRSDIGKEKEHTRTVAELVITLGFIFGLCELVVHLISG